MFRFPIFPLLLALGLAGAFPAAAGQDNRKQLAPAPASAVAPMPGVAEALAELLAAVPTAIAGVPVKAEALRAFYAERDFAPVWLDSAGATVEARLVMAALAATRADGSPQTAALLDAVAAAAEATTPAAGAAFEALLSQAAMRFGSLEPGEDAAERQALNAAAADPAGFIADALPRHPLYWRLRTGYETYLGFVARGDWPSVPQGAKLESGMRGARVATLRQRLLATGELADSGTDAELFDAALEAAVIRFQTRHGLAADGVAGFGTFDAMNVPLDQRLKTLRLNLDRLRLMRPDWSRPLIAVNIAAAEVDLIENGAVAYHSRVVVGRKDRPTPLVTSEVRRIELNPYWNVPIKIARLDLLPKAQKNSRYFDDLNIRVYSGYTEASSEIDPATVDWFSPEAKQYRLRQDPGPENALGPVKIAFPNDYDVFLHGTTHKELFVKPARFFSSGCIRLEDPLHVAALVLRGEPNWSRAEIDRVIASGKTTVIHLSQPVPVRLDYLTAWVDAEGTVQFRADIYGLDRKPAVARDPTKKS
jgi:murein L,D-transpeptidase YcbB/YkuD